MGRYIDIVATTRRQSSQKVLFRKPSSRVVATFFCEGKVSVKASGDQKKGGQGTGGGKGKSDWRQVVWVNPKPTSEDVTWLESNENNLVEFVVAMVADLREGERLSVKRDTRSDRWLAILFMGSSSDPNGVQALSVRGATAFDACALLYYFHCVKFVDGWAQDSDAPVGRFG